MWRRNSVLDFFLKETFGGEPDVLAVKSMLFNITNVLNELRMLNGVIFVQNERVYGVTPYWNFNGSQSTEALKACMDQNGAGYVTVWRGVYSLQDFTDTPLTLSPHVQCRYLTGVRRMRYATLSQPFDVTFLALISTDEIADIIRRVVTGSDEVALLDGEGRLLAGDELGLAGQRWESLSGELDYTVDEKRYRVFYRRVADKGWVVARRMDRDAYQRQAMSLRVRSYGIGLGAVAAMVALYAFFARLFFKPFQQVMGLFRQVRDGKLDARLPAFPRRVLPVAEEMQTMRTQLNAMLDSIGELIRRSEQVNRERAALEMQALQRQLNPHMIFNTLTSIRWMVMLHQGEWSGSEKVEDMLVEFAGLLQPLFDDIRSCWSLREELAHLGHYIALLRMRYCADFDLIDETGGAMDEFLLPRFVLQPVLENSCEHGLVGSACLRVEVRVSVRDGFLRLSVRDDGCGITAEKLALLQARLRGEEAIAETGVGRSGIALINVHRRLRAQFGETSGLIVESEPGQGTHVTLLIRWTG